MTLQCSQPIIIALKQSPLYPLHLHSAITITHVSSGKREYAPRVDPSLSLPIPSVTRQHKDDFVGLRPGEETVVPVDVRPHNEPYDYGKLKDEKGADRYRFIFPIGMQFLKPGEEYEIGIGPVQHHAYMIGDLDEMVAEGTDGSEWRPAEGSLEIVAGEKCRFRVEA